MSGAARLAVVLVLGSCFGCVTPVVYTGTPGQVGEYRIAPPDLLRIDVRPEPVISRAVVVRPDGRISFDLIGDVEVEARTVEEIRAEITQRISEFIVSPDVTVELTESRSRRYYVVGQVNRPGSFPLIGRVTAVEALASSSGGTLFASLNSSRLVRVSAEDAGVFAVRFSDITERGDGRTNYELKPGDIIYVPPNLSARIGLAIQNILFPVQSIVGLGRTAVGTARGW